MENITINKTDLIEVKNDLNESIDSLDGLSCAIDCCLLEEDWQIVDEIFSLISESVKRIERILQ